MFDAWFGEYMDGATGDITPGIGGNGEEHDYYDTVSHEEWFG